MHWIPSKSSIFMATHNIDFPFTKDTHKNKMKWTFFLFWIYFHFEKKFRDILIKCFLQNDIKFECFCGNVTATFTGKCRKSKKCSLNIVQHLFLPCIDSKMSWHNCTAINKTHTGWILLFIEKNVKIFWMTDWLLSWNYK